MCLVEIFMWAGNLFITKSVSRGDLINIECFLLREVGRRQTEAFRINLTIVRLVKVTSMSSRNFPNMVVK